MSLPSPNLDNRSFQEIVDDIKRQIGRRCPEWTDHNVSDPGITLIELFASMTEMMLYQLNQVPEKNYLKFLEMIGVSLESPAPAQTELRFRLSRPIEDIEGEESFAHTLRARETVASTLRTEQEESVEFCTDRDLRFVRPYLSFVKAIPASEVGVTGEQAAIGARDFIPGRAFTVYSAVPRTGDALFLGFEADVSGNVVQFEINSVRSAATGLNEDYPAQQWEAWNGAENRWDLLEVSDTTYGFNRPPGQFKNDLPTGYIEIALPPGLLKRQIDGKSAYWVRCRYTTALPPRGPEQQVPDSYQKSPEFLNLTARVVGGTVSASNCATVLHKDLGQSDGTPGQIFALGHAPILPRRPGETVAVGEQGIAREEMEEWTEVEDFADSGPEDRHFVCDSYTGQILFGPEILQPEGGVRQYGAVPRKGLTLVITGYRHGGGTRGNIAAGQATVMKSSIPYIAEVVNPRRAYGGREQESVERAKMRGRAILRHRARAVTAEDYEYFACRASSGVSRARCVQPRALHSRAGGIPPGVIRVLLVPTLDETVSVPRPADLRVPDQVRREVEEYLDFRRLLTSVLEVGEPEYVYISTEIKLVADPKADADQVVRNVRTQMENFLHPLRGGPNGDGWPFRRALTLADIYAQVQEAHGVAFLLDARVYVSRLTTGSQTMLTSETLVPNTDAVLVGDNELLCTREHRIRAVPMSQVGMEEAEGRG